ncbi:MAG: hypothetical protein Q9195_001018 [Heterodermia aff. obscurata]
MAKALKDLDVKAESLNSKKVASRLSDTIIHQHATIYSDFTRALRVRDNVLAAASDVKEDNEDEDEDENEDENEDEDGEMVDPFDIEADDPTPLAGGGAVILNGQTMLVHKWLGDSYTERILRVTKAPPVETIDGLRTVLRDYQKMGVGKMLQCWREPSRTAIVGDQMGLGKSLMTLVACLKDRTSVERRSHRFDLIITTKSCVKQWKYECRRHFAEGHQPIIYHLRDNKVTAKTLISMDVDFIICTYQFLQNMYSSMNRTKDYFATARTEGRAVADSRYSNIVKKRQTLSLISPVFNIMEISIGHLILDESQFVKNDRCQTHLAIKSLQYQKLAALSGTFVANRWYDIYGTWSLVPGENPFVSRSDFHRIFGNPYHSGPEPSNHRLDRLIKALMPLVIARPSSILNLKGLDTSVYHFSLDQADIEMVVYFTKLFVESLRKAKRYYTDVNGMLSADKTQRSILYATRAQQYAAHAALIPKKHQPLKSVSREMQMLLALFEQYASHEEGSSVSGPRKRQLLAKFVTEDDHGNPSSEGEPSMEDNSAEDLEFDPDKESLSEDDDFDVEEDEEEEGAGKKEKDQLWIRQVQNMSDEQLFSPRVEAVCAVYKTWIKKDPNERVVILSKFKKFLDIVAEAVKRRFRKESLRFDGSKSMDERHMILESFRNMPGGPLLITPKSGGAGLNIEFASKLIQCEIWWVHNDELQAYGRLYRSGQEFCVEAVVLEAIDSAIDEVIKVARDSKTEFNDRIMKPLTRLDNEPPNIPEIQRQPA